MRPAHQRRKLEAFVTEAAIDLLGRLTVAGELASPTPSDTLTKAVETNQQQLADLNQTWTAKDITTAEYRAMRKEIADRIARAQRRMVVRPMKLFKGLTGPGARAAWEDEEMTDERRNAVLRFLFSGVVIDASNKPSGVFDWDQRGPETALTIVEALADGGGVEGRDPCGKIVWSHFKTVTAVQPA